MPRTKRPVKKQEKTVEENEALKKWNKMVLDQKKKIDSRVDMELRNVELAFKILLGSISTSYLNKTMRELNTELHLKEVTNTRSTRNSGRSASQDDGYLTENSQGSGDKPKKFAEPAVPRTARRSRSATASTRKLATSLKPARRQSRSVYRTPAYNKNAIDNYPAITPKVTKDTALTLLRQPRQGEMVVSMSGSPVMVPTVYNMQPGEKASCNIMLQDGTMLSLQPKQLRQSLDYIPFSLMDSKVLQQLQTLKDNIDKVVKLGVKTVRD